MATHKAHATPTKDFFVRMITKDISIEDCILDLIDNCLDGARKVKYVQGSNARIDDYSGFHAKVSFDKESFEIIDNCGGITIEEAEKYAFHFGPRPRNHVDDYSIGLYGIGMKRAIFKMGNVIDIYSSTHTKAFTTKIDVIQWLPNADDWDFDLEDNVSVNPDSGTKIKVTNLHPEVSLQFINSKFANSLARIIARDYAQFLAKGFEIVLNGKNIQEYNFTVRESSDFKPFRLQYTDETGVEVEIIAGMGGDPPNDLQPDERLSETDYYGWYVLCNDRVVVAADKSSQTVWGDNTFPLWHFQYYGFLGVVSFHSKDPILLPWKTTKREVDSRNGIYRRAIEKMKEATRTWIDYTNDRKSDIKDAKKHEATASPKPLFTVSPNPVLVVPKISKKTDQISYSSIQYQKPSSEIAKAKKLLGNSRMSNAQLGEKTFEYFLDNEAEE